MVVNTVRSYKNGKETVFADYSLYFINLLCDKVGIKSISELDSIFSQGSEIKTLFDILECAIESYNYLNDIEGVDAHKQAVKCMAQNPKLLKEIPAAISTAFKVFNDGEATSDSGSKKK